MKNFFITIAIMFSLSISAQEVDFTLPDMNSQDKTYDDLKGAKLTVIDFWATWCKPCSQLIPKLNELQTTFKDEVTIIGVSIDSPRSMNKVRPYATTMGVNYPILLDPDQELSGDLSISSIPTLILVNNEGEIVWTHEGYSLGDEKKIEQKIAYYLEKL